MSTILNALKRLEKERQEENAPRALRSMTGGARRRRHFPYMMIALLAVVLGAVVLIWLNGGLSIRVFSRKTPALEPPVAAVAPDALKKKTPKASVAGKQVAATAERGETAQTTPAPASLEVIKPPAPVARQTVAPRYSKDLQARPLPQIPLPEQSSTGDRRASAGDIVEQPPPQQAIGTDRMQPAAQKANPPQTAIGRQPISPSANSRETEPLARGILTLQAISWSDVRSARLTIIDGRILREGDTIEGFTVVLIRPDNVIVGKNGKRWRLAYDNQ